MPPARALPGRDQRHRAQLQNAAPWNKRLARQVQQLRASAQMLAIDKPLRAKAVEAVLELAQQRQDRLDRDVKLLAQWPQMQTPTQAMNTW